ncbi:MAG: neutral zinc metallopeptidase [Planctomycetota bacterium]
MRWEQGRRSENVEDRRGGGAAKKAAVAGGGGIILVIIAMLLGIDPSKLLSGSGSPGGSPFGASANSDASPRVVDPAEEKLADFVSVVLGDTEDVWNELFRTDPTLRQQRNEYAEPKLVLFRDMVASACGQQSSAVGPFYCPADQRVYLDLGFFEVLHSRLRAQGDFAQAYVIAHEVGHHVQNLLGVSERVHAMRSRLSEAEFNELSVRLELQADFYAGVWAHHAQKARNVLEKGDIEEALNAAAAIGDDKLQREGRGVVRPETFTHGTSEQRARWFRLGLSTGDPKAGDTFSAKKL